MTTQALSNGFVDHRPAAVAAADGRTHRASLGLLLWLFGFTGAHRFYFGKSVSGTVQFALFALTTAFTFLLGPFAWVTVGLPLLVWWVVDFFLIGSMKRSAGRTYVAGPYSYSMAWILQTFLGWAGVHRLYLGKWVTGATMLVMSLAVPGTLFLLWPLALVCGAIYLIDFWTLNEQVSERNAAAVTQS